MDTRISNNRGQENHAVFNMALSTLERLSDILREIRVLSTQYFLPPEVKQNQYLQLVKQFFLNAVPLIPKEKVKEYQVKMETLEAREVNLIQRGATGTTNYQGKKAVYDKELEKNLNNFLVDLQLELQELKYFMPSRKDPRFSWSNE